VRIIGVISDTHGLVRPEALEALRGADHIIHAGDIGGQHVVDALRKIAPLTFVNGNNDPGSEGLDIVRVRFGDLRILVTHILPRPRKPHRHVLESLAREPADIVVFGHSHLPHNEMIGGVRYFNPASAGPRRFDYPVSAGLIESGETRHIALDALSVAALTTRMNQLTKTKSA
jgi:putative phosphoesterase